jgi:hypothetical protein
MVRRRILGTAAACVAGVLLVSACGGSSSGGSEPIAHGSARTVRDLHTVSQAQRYFRALRGHEGVNDALTGLAQGGFTKADGSVLAMKDAMILTVDVTALPPTQIDRTGIAIDVASTVLGCWTADS